MGARETERDGMKTIDEEMLLIKSLDPWASIRFSEYTKKWYIDAKIEESTGEVIGGITEHAETPALAVSRYLNRLKSLPLHMVIVTRANYEDRRHWWWNGVAFAEEPVERLMSRVAAGRQRGVK